MANAIAALQNERRSLGLLAAQWKLYSRAKYGAALQVTLVVGLPATLEGGQLRIELRGNLAAMLTAAHTTKRSPETGDLHVPIQLVAGACNRRYFLLWSGAA